MAANRGNSAGMCNYVIMLSHGDGIPVDKREALRYYKISTEKGDSNAMNNYGYMLDHGNGNGIQVEKRLAVRYYKMAILKSNVQLWTHVKAR